MSSSGAADKKRKDGPEEEPARLHVLLASIEDGCTISRWVFDLKPATVQEVFHDYLYDDAQQYLTAIAYAEDPAFKELREKKIDEADGAYNYFELVEEWARAHCVKEESEEYTEGWWNVECKAEPNKVRARGYDRVYMVPCGSLVD